MTNSKTTKRALFSSVVALLLCFTMLLGTTFAWFTDSASTGVNTIQAGNLDIVVYYATQSDVVEGKIADDAWKEVDANTPVFNPAALWEPGYTEIVYFKAVNAGSLSLKYHMGVQINDEVGGTNVDGQPFKLSDYIQAYACQATDYQFSPLTSREMASDADYLASIGAPDPFSDTLANGVQGDYDGWETSNFNSLSLNLSQWLEPAETWYTTLVLFMPTTVGNEANYKTGTTAPSINMGINFVATQYNWENEKDSFDENYDKDAEYPEIITYDYVVNSVDELKAAFAEGGNILLNADLDITETLDVPAGKEVLLNLNGKTISMPDGQNVNTVPALFKVKMGDTADGPVGKLIIEGDGTVDVGNNGAAAIFPGGDVIINGGTFIRDLTGIDLDDAYPLISGYNQNKYPNNNLGTLVINGGYFDGGFYNTEADKLFNGFVETHEAGQGQPSDTNAIRLAVKDNMTALINESNFKAGEGFVVTGGTFVGANPAWGDEGCMLPSDYNGNYLRPWSYYQGGFIPGQVFNENNIVLPAGYSITEGVTADGIPTYTVNYSK